MVLPTDPLDRVRVGMPVVDASGARLGTVARVQGAAPPVTHPPDSDLIDEMARLVPSPPDMTDLGHMDIIGPSPVGHDPADLPGLPDPLREHLARVGFVEIDGDLPATERYIAGDHIEEVGQDRVVVRRPR